VLVTEVLAGTDGVDPRQPRDLTVEDYSGSVVSGKTVAVLSEGLSVEGADPAVVDAFTAAVTTLEDRGVEVETVSVPIHERAGDLSVVIAVYGTGRPFGQHGLAPWVDG